jgi:hypothetical protein
MFGIECRKHAPELNQVPNHQDLREFVPVFPIMKDIDWCGEFEIEKGDDS